MEPFRRRTSALIWLPSQSGATGLKLSCRRARFAVVSLRPVVLDLGVLALASLLHFRAFFVPMYQIRTEQIDFIIQSDKLTHQVVLHLAVHLSIVHTVAVTRLAVYNV